MSLTMRYANAFYLLIRIALLGVIPYETDFAEVMELARQNRLASPSYLVSLH